jgi:acetyl-CoA carboxylase carboxyltransferase component
MGMRVIAFKSPLAGRVAAILCPAGTLVRAGEPMLLVEAMKMEHELHAPFDGLLREWRCAVGQEVSEGETLLFLEQQSATGRLLSAQNTQKTALEGNLGPSEAVLKLRARLSQTEDAARPQSVAKRHSLGLRTARENIADLCDAGSFSEYGALAIAAQTQRRPIDELRALTPADGMVCGTAHVGGVRVAVAAYDATVLAGTQGMRNHQKLDRILSVALRERLPFVLFAEGGGGRPGDTDMPIVAGLHVTSFAGLARLAGEVPLIGIAGGRCFAGNAALLGCCDVVIATRGANIGLGGPAMIEGAGLGQFAPEEIGPAEELARCGVVDVLVDDEAQAVQIARALLALPQLAHEWQAPRADAISTVIPPARARAYDARLLMQGVADVGSVVEWQSGFGQAVHTALARIEGRAIGLIASNPQHQAGAVDADAAKKLERFLQLCKSWKLPIVSLIDTPGFMVGPESEREGHVRHAARVFTAAAQLGQAWVSVVVRRGFGLGAMALAGGGFHESTAIAAWPQAEFGAMGLEGAVRLGWRKELEALDGPAREQREAELLQTLIDEGSAMRMAETLEIDAVIEPQQTRAWVLKSLA